MGSTTRAAAASGLGQLLELLDESFQRRSWHGTNLRGSVRGVTAAQAAWRPPAGKRSIADIIVHCAYWKYSVRRRLRGDKRGSFALPGSNWFALPEPLSPTAWREYVALLGAEHAALRAAVADLPPGRLDALPRGGKTRIGTLIRGAALHDTYHAGQIQLIKALLRRSADAAARRD